MKSLHTEFPNVFLCLHAPYSVGLCRMCQLVPFRAQCNSLCSVCVGMRLAYIISNRTAYPILFSTARLTLLTSCACPRMSYLCPPEQQHTTYTQSRKVGAHSTYRCVCRALSTHWAYARQKAPQIKKPPGLSARGSRCRLVCCLLVGSAFGVPFGVVA